MSLLLLLRADPRATFTSDVQTGIATLTVTFTVDDLDPGVHAGGANPLWRFDAGDGSAPLYFDAGTWSIAPAGTGDTPGPGDPIVYAYTTGSGGPRDATISFETDDGVYIAARLALDIEDGIPPVGTLTSDEYLGLVSLNVVLTADLVDDAGLTVTGWDIDFGDASFLGFTAGSPSAELVPHTYVAPFFGAPRLLIYATELASPLVLAAGPFITVAAAGTVDPPRVTVRIYEVGATSPIVTATAVEHPSITENLDESDTADFTVALDAFTPSQLRCGRHEVQIIYRSRCYWMRVTHATVDLKRFKVTFHCVGLESWFDERFLGEATDNNLGTQMSFEEDLPLHQPHPENPNPNVWITTDPSSNTSAAHLTATRFAGDSLVGDYCAKLVGTNAAIRSFLYQNAATTWRPGVQLADVIGQRVFMSAWYKILAQNYVDWIGPPPPGLMIQTHISGDPLGAGRVATAPLDTHEAEKDVWQRIEIGESEALHVPPNIGAINWFLAAVPGTILWDGVRLTVDPKLNFQKMDIARVVSRLARYAQNTMTDPPQPSIKTDLHLVPSVTDTGVTVSRRYHLHERSQISSLIREYIDREDGVDVWVHVDCESGTRTLRIAPERGSVHADAILRWGGSDPTVSIEVPVEVDGRAGTNAAVITSQFQGPAGEYGFANDLSTWGGITRESVTSAASDTPIDALQGLALQNRKRHNAQEVLPTFRASAELILDNPDYDLHVGDSVPIEVTAGWLQINQTMRIGQMVLDCDTDQVTIVPLQTVQRGKQQKHTMARIVGNLRERLAKVEQTRVSTPYKPRIVREVISWGPEGPEPGMESSPDPTPNGGLLEHALATVEPVSGGFTSIDVLIDGIVKGTIVVPPGERTGYSGTIGLAMFPDQQHLSFRIINCDPDVDRLLCQARLY